MSRSDDAPTVIAISVLAAMLADVLHEGLGHALVALTTGVSSGVLSTVAWSSQYDSRLVASAGTLLNLAAGVVFWMFLRKATTASARLRFFLWISCAFNLFAGTGYFFLSGVTDFGDWAVVIAGLQPHWLWRVALIVVGMGTYYATMLMLAAGIARHLGIQRDDRSSLRKVTLIPYFSAIVLLSVAGLLNPIGIRLVVQSALSATAGANFGLLWLQHLIPERTAPGEQSAGIGRSFTWISTAAVSPLLFIFVLGPGITLTR